MSDSAERTFEVLNEAGLHARPATKIVQTAARFKSEVELEREGQRANAKSVMGVLLLGCHKGSRVTVRARGGDADSAVAAIGELFANRFGER
jgi:phosphocarrier protein